MVITNMCRAAMCCITGVEVCRLCVLTLQIALGSCCFWSDASLGRFACFRLVPHSCFRLPGLLRKFRYYRVQCFGLGLRLTCQYKGDIYGCYC